jgi:tetratricopeptide (TPR) repeat protein
MRRALCAICLSLSVSGSAAQVASTADLLDRYGRGDYASFTAPGTPLDLQRMRQGVMHDGESWIKRGSDREARRRALVVASVALELARASVDIDWGEGRQLIEWAAELLRKGPPDDAERVWHLAALALMQSASDNELLLKQQKQAWPRFEAESRFLLALVVMLEADTWPDPDRGEPWDTNDAALQEAFETNAARRAARAGGLPDLRAKSYEYQRRTRMRSAITLLEDLSNEVSIRGEVVLRLGFLHLRLRHSEIAIEQFEDVLTLSKDPYLLYLAHFLTAVAHEQDGDRANAVMSYRAALAVVPRAQSASVALASLLFIGNDREEAAKLIDAAIAKPIAEDPWRSYQTGDARFWNERLLALREVIR